MNTQELLAERGATYGDAWLVTGIIVELLRQRRLLDRIISSSYFYNWITILCKLVRLLATPNHLDSWRDIIGYAQLIVDREVRLGAASKESSLQSEEMRND